MVFLRHVLSTGALGWNQCCILRHVLSTGALGWNHVLIMNLRPGGMTIVQQQGMEVLGVNLSPSVLVKD